MIWHCVGVNVGSNLHADAVVDGAPTSCIIFDGSAMMRELGRPCFGYDDGR